jgi:hypothetical protein
MAKTPKLPKSSKGSGGIGSRVIPKDPNQMGTHDGKVWK